MLEKKKYRNYIAILVQFYRNTKQKNDTKVAFGCFIGIMQELEKHARYKFNLQQFRSPPFKNQDHLVKNQDRLSKSNSVSIFCV